MKRRLIIAPYEAHRVLFNDIRKNDPFADVKFLSLEELVKNFYYNYNLESAKYLIKNHGFDLSTANQLISDVVMLPEYNTYHDECIDSLFAYKGELLNEGLLVKNDLFNNVLSNSDISVYYYSKDNPFLKRILKNHPYTFVELDGNAPQEFKSFANSDDQLFYVFNQIEKLISSGIKPEKIFIYGLQEDDEVIFNRLSYNYKINFNDCFDKPLISKPDVLKAVKSFNGNIEDIKFSLNDKSNYFEQVIEAFKAYFVEGLDVKQQINLYRDAFRRINIKKDRYVEAIRSINEPIIADDEYLFFLNFAQGIYPRVYRDDDIVDDSVKQILDLPTSDEKNVDSVSYYTDLLKSRGHIIVCFAKSDFSSIYIPSPIKDTFKLKEAFDNDENDVYSIQEAKLQLANILDIKRKYLHESSLLDSYKQQINIPYLLYDSSFKGAKHFQPVDVLKLSYSQAKTFYQCRYKYYLNNVLKVDEIEDSFALTLGKILHEVLQYIDKDISFEDLFAMAVEHSKSDLKPNDYIFLPKCKAEFENTFNYIKKYESQIQNPSFYREQKLYVELTPNINLIGTIDKAILSGDSKQYLSIVDYKTSSESFNESKLKFGQCLQLPTYVLLAKLHPLFKDKTVVNIATERLLSDAVNKYTNKEDDYFKSLKIGGITLGDIDAINSLDSNYEFIKDIKIDSKTGNIDISKLKNEAWFDSVGDIAKTKLIYAGNEIINNRFTIDPKMIGGKIEACEHCPFRDICFRTNKDVVVLTNDEEGDSNGGN